MSPSQLELVSSSSFSLLFSFLFSNSFLICLFFSISLSSQASSSSNNKIVFLGGIGSVNQLCKCQRTCRLRQPSLSDFHFGSLFLCNFLFMIILYNSRQSRPPRLIMSVEGQIFSYPQQTTKGHLQTHIKSVHEGLKFQCPQCEHKATRERNLHMHIKSVHEGLKFQCPHCDHKATQNSSLKEHIKSIHEGEVIL